jgi:hypothetical protein
MMADDKTMFLWPREEIQIYCENLLIWAKVTQVNNEAHPPLFFLSSPELKVQMSFSDCPLSVICLKTFTFLTSSPDPLSQF